MFDILAAVDSRKHEFVVDFGAKAKYVLLGVATLVNRRFGPDISGFVKKVAQKCSLVAFFGFDKSPPNCARIFETNLLLQIIPRKVSLMQKKIKKSFSFNN